MSELIIAPLAAPGSVTEAARTAIFNAKRLYLQTAEHPCSEFIKAAGIDYISMDDLYASSEDFDALNLAVAQRIVSGEDAVYAVLGRGVGGAQLAAITAEAKRRNTSVRTLPSSGFFEAALNVLDEPVDLNSYRLCPANGLPRRIDPYTPLIIEELDTKLRAGEVKLTLTRIFPDGHPVILFFMDASGVYSYKRLPLCELDRENRFDAGSVLYVPAAEFMSLTRYDMYGLVDVMDRLRSPGGCPWDAEQTHQTLKANLIEETYEVLDAIDAEDMDALCEELGDLMLQIVFHARMEKERGEFDIDDVATGIVQKLVYRHPHVFGTTSVSGSADVLKNWEQLKKKEKHFSTQSEMMRAVPRGFPALMRSAKVQKKAANVGFDWADAKGALTKVYEEADEVGEALTSHDKERITDELGDLLFSAVNVSRLTKCDPELALTAATDKFMRRFELMEAQIVSDGGVMADMTLGQMNEYWDKVKETP